MYNLLSIMGNPKPYSGFYVQDVSGQANTIKITKTVSGAPTLTIETSTNGRGWTIVGTTSTTALNISVPANGKVYVRCSATEWGYHGLALFDEGANNFTATRNFKVGGNILSLLYGKDFTGNETTFRGRSSSYQFYKLFYNCINLTDISDLLLPATTLESSCYNSMFYGCTSLTQAPVLPATTLESSCYNSMFYGCTSLTAAPVLPATTLSTYSYRNMFLNCTSLNSVTCLAENISATNCTTNWLYGVSATGTFTKSPNMSSWTTGTNGIPSGWTVVDAS